MSNKISNFNPIPVEDNKVVFKKENQKINALREISEHLQVIANLIEVQEEAAKKIGMIYNAEHDTTILELIDKAKQLARQANITLEIDIKQYTGSTSSTISDNVEENDEDEDERQWQNSGCSDGEWNSSGC